LGFRTSKAPRMAFRRYGRYHSSVQMRAMRKLVLAVIVGIGLTCLALIFVKAPSHRLNVRTYLRNAQGLQSGTPVSIDGVRVGSVTSVDVRPELGDHPVEAVMMIGTSYKLTVPNDSVVRLTAEGALGPTVLEIDTRKAVGPPAENNGVLKSMEATDNQGARALEFMGNVLIDASKKIRDKDRSPSPPPDPSK